MNVESIAITNTRSYLFEICFVINEKKANLVYFALDMTSGTTIFALKTSEIIKELETLQPYYNL